MSFLSFDFSDVTSLTTRAEDVDEEHGDDEGPVAHEKVCPVLERGVTAQMLVDRVRVSGSEASRIEGYEQGTKEWHLSRRGSQTRIDGEIYSTLAKDEPGFRFLPGRLTASNFGTAVGHNKYSPPEELVKDMLWGTVVSNEAMAYGSKMEPVACHIFETALFFLTGGGIEIEHRGLMLGCPGLRVEQEEGTGKEGEQEAVYEGWAGTSPDGIIHWKRPSQPSPHSPSPPRPSLLEIKCPSVNKRNFYSERYGNERFRIPHYYYDQIMGICGLNHLPDAYFVVYLPDRTQVQKFEFNEPYFRELFKGMRSFWFDKYLPAAVACAQGRMIVGQVTPLEAPAVHISSDHYNSAMLEAHQLLQEITQHGVGGKD